MTVPNTELFHKVFMALPSAQAIWAFGVLMTLSMIYRLLAEWQRRITVDHIFAHAPGGSVIFQDKSMAGPAMSIWVGAGPYPPPTTVHLVVHDLRTQRELLRGGDR
ncbi:hypothetical protein AB0J80_13840 [Actinoplanes sp. NPDC049548]|uniref:hypothetical protein n=1 Tax=Actinoplanes sp. NPDC049548 TaxID=3155152 RepID=UPI00343E08E3